MNENELYKQYFITNTIDCKVYIVKARIKSASESH